MAYTVYNCDSMTGGAARSLDILSVATLTEGDRAIVMTTAAAYFFKYSSTATAAEQVATAPRVVRPDDYSSAGNWEEYVPAVSGSSVLVKVAHASTAAAASGSTITPCDNTIPQVTEGNEILTCAITPGSTSNMLLIQAVVNGLYCAAAGDATLALFQSYTGYSSTDALAAVTGIITQNYSYAPLVLFHKMTAPTSSYEITYSLRLGNASSGTIYINTIGGAATKAYNDKASTTLTIMEYTV
jgi:hypothetical protein